MNFDTIFKIILPIAGWIIGYFSSIYGSQCLEKRRAIRTLITEVELIRADIHSLADFPAIHDQSIERMKPLFFSAMAFLDRESHKEAREIWESHRRCRIEEYDDNNFATKMGKGIGETITTKEEALHMSLDKIQSFFENTH